MNPHITENSYALFYDMFLKYNFAPQTFSSATDRTLDLTLPNTLQHIGTASFAANPIVELNIPSSIEYT